MGIARSEVIFRGGGLWVDRIPLIHVNLSDRGVQWTLRVCFAALNHLEPYKNHTLKEGGCKIYILSVIVPGQEGEGLPHSCPLKLTKKGNTPKKAPMFKAEPP